MSKPSQWTPQEAWDTLRKRVVQELYDRGWKDAADVIRRCEMFAFPSDPPERVSDDDLNMIVAMGEEARQTVRKMALELIERRKAEKERGQ